MEPERSEAAIPMRDWSAFEGLADAITASGHFRRIERDGLTFTHRNGTAIDLLPHGDIANRDRRSSPSAATRCRRRPTSSTCWPEGRRSRPPGARCTRSPAPRSARTFGRVLPPQPAKALLPRQNTPTSSGPSVVVGPTAVADPAGLASAGRSPGLLARGRRLRAGRAGHLRRVGLGRLEGWNG